MKIVEHFLSNAFAMAKSFLTFGLATYCLIVPALAQGSVADAQQPAVPSTLELARRLDAIKELFEYIGIAFTIFGAAAASAAIIGIFSWLRGERKFKELYEKVSINLDLVNKVLDISNRTLEKAASAALKQAQRMRRDIDHAARDYTRKTW